MKEINTNDLKFIGGAGGRDLAQWGAGGAVLALTKKWPGITCRRLCCG
jgi:hypothetical protein